MGTKGNKEVSMKVFGALSAKLPTSLLIKLTKQRTIVPLYHLISDQQVDHIKHLYPIKSTTAFEKDLDFFLKHYSPVDFLTFREQQTNPKASKKHNCLITFDDGLSEFHDVISPILLRKGVPAICFLNSDFIDNKALFFRYKASLLIDAIEKKKKVLNSPSIQTWMGEKTTNYKERILAVSYKDKESLGFLACELGVDFNLYLKEQKPYMASDQIRSLIGKGFHFGSHSCDHPEYQKLDLPEQLHQTIKSTEEISSKFSLSYKAFAFPFTDHGVSRTFFNKVLEEGNIVDLSFGCAGMKSETFKGHIQRIPFEWGDKEAREILNTEYFYFMVKALFRKNTIERKW